jgi:hypothetical protein
MVDGGVAGACGVGAAGVAAGGVAGCVFVGGIAGWVWAIERGAAIESMNAAAPAKARLVLIVHSFRRFPHGRECAAVHPGPRELRAGSAAFPAGAP